MKRQYILFTSVITLLAAGCSQKETVKSDELSGTSMTSEITLRGTPYRSRGNSEAVLKASVFKMNGDYANQVAVGVNSSGDLTYFPAPSDITQSSCPVEIGDGWWLNRQGIAKGYKFTRYTFSEYSSLKKTPSPEEILKAIIPGAEVTEFRMLDIPSSEAMERLTEIKEDLKIK